MWPNSVKGVQYILGSAQPDWFLRLESRRRNPTGPVDVQRWRDVILACLQRSGPHRLSNSPFSATQSINLESLRRMRGQLNFCKLRFRTAPLCRGTGDFDFLWKID